MSFDLDTHAVCKKIIYGFFSMDPHLVNQWIYYCVCTQDAHESEVSAVRWSPVDHVVATGGADRRVRLWDVSKGNYASI